MDREDYDKLRSCIELNEDSDQIVKANESLHSEFGKTQQELHTWLPRVIQFKRSGICCVSCSPDGQYIVSGWYGGIQQFNTDNEACVGRFMLRHTSCVRQVDYSSNGQFLISLSYGFSDNCIAITTWFANNHKIIRNLYIHKKKGIFTLAFAKNDHLLASTDQNAKIYIWYIKKGKQIRRIVGHQYKVSQIQFSHDSQFILSASLDKNIILWYISSAKQKFVYIDQTCVRSAQFSPDESKIATSNFDNIIHIWDTQTGLQTQEKIKIIKPIIIKLYFSPDGKALFILTDEGIIIWDFQTCMQVGKIKNEGGFLITDVHFSPIGKFMIVIDDITIRILRVSDYQSFDHSEIKNH